MPIHNGQFHNNHFPKKIHFICQKNFVEPGVEWLNLVLWAQNVFAECSHVANEAHETIQAVFFGKRIKKKIYKFFSSFKYTPNLFTQQIYC